MQAPTRRGFGATIIERSIPYELKGEAEVRYELTGVEARFTLPPSLVRIAPQAAVKAAKPAAAVTPRSLAGTTWSSRTT